MKSFQFSIAGESRAFVEVDCTRARGEREPECAANKNTFHKRPLPRNTDYVKGDNVCRNFGDDYEPTPCLVPTRHLPGTNGKLRVMIERASSGQDIWHPEDNLGRDIDDERFGEFDFAEFLADLEGLR